MFDKKSDLAGPGISTYDQVSKILPDNYEAPLSPLKRMEALYLIKEYIEKGLAEALNLQMVQVPLIVSKDSGVNDYLDRDPTFCSDIHVFLRQVVPPQARFGLFPPGGIHAAREPLRSRVCV